MCITKTLPFLLTGVLSSGICFAQSWVQPYDGVGASPFQDFGMLETFSVEDFEDGEVNIRGVTLVPSNGMEEGTLEITSTPTVSTANSVAEDTGDPSTGTMVLGVPFLCASSYPPLCPATATFEFAEPHPTFVGFVWTDAVRSSIPQSGLPFGVATVTTSAEELIVERVFDRPAYDPDNVTADDLFFAFVAEDGIQSLQFNVVTDLFGGYLSVDHLQVGFASVVGDSNRDGVVNFDDFLPLSENFGQDGGWAEGDFNFDGRVEFLDFLQLSSHFGDQFDMPFAAVPEPSANAIAFLLSLCAWLFVRHRRQRSWTT